MLDNDTLGVYSIVDGKWYYLDSGKIKITNTFHRVIQTLTKRGLIFIDKENPARQQKQYIPMTAATAKAKQYEIVPIYLNEHIKALAEAGEIEIKPGCWGKK